MMRLFLAAVLALCLTPSALLAQGWQGRFLISANGAMLATASTFEDDFTYTHPFSANLPGEEARVESRYELPRGALFDGTVAYRLWKNLGAGVAFSQSSSTSNFDITARIPHPLLIGRHREVQGTTAARHSESAIHVNALYVFPATRRLYVGVSGGPTHFTVEQRLVRTVSVSESFPYDTATFASADLETARETAWGFNAGVDVGWMFNRNFGVGGLLRYSAATITLSPTGRDPRDLEAGGLHGGLGARIAF